MSVSSFFETSPVAQTQVVSGLQLFSGFERAKQFEQDLFVEDSRVTQAFLKSQVHRHEETEESSRMTCRYSCVKGLVGGGLGSLLIQHPLPLLFGLRDYEKIN